MTGPVRTPTAKKHVQPPRPPNAWILYRSEKIQTLPPLQPGEARRAQADVSRMISEMWKNESEEERGRYERMAEQKKAEHQQKYPGYRFQPQKKEEKQRQRELMKQERQNNREARKNRGRSQATSTPTPTFAAPPLPYFNAQFYTPETQYGPAGPSPPMSAAPSPCIDSASSPESDEQTTQTRRANNGQQQTPMLASFILPDSQTHPSETQWAASQTAVHPDLVTTLEWNHPTLPTADNTSAEFVSFDVQSLPTSVPQSWLSNAEPDGLEQALQAFLSSTADPSIFHLNNIDVDQLTANPTGEIEISMGQVPLAFEDILPPSFPDFTNFDFSNMAGPSSQPLDVVSPLTNANTASLLPPSQTLRLNSGSSDNAAYNAEEFLNFDEISLNAFPVTSTTETLQQSQNSGPLETATSNVSTPCSNSYVPPSGAAYSSTRRVGATWKPPPYIETDSAMERSPARAWRVPAN